MGVAESPDGGDMSLPLSPLPGTEGLGKNSRCGIQKHWPFASRLEDNLHWSYIQKVNYSVQDFNDFLAEKKELTREGIVFLITLTDWIKDGVEKILDCYPQSIISNLEFSKQDELETMIQYHRALRSFLVAHPLNTTRHGLFGFDGSIICIDIRNKSRFVDIVNSNLFELTPHSMTKTETLQSSDIVIYAYSKQDDAIQFWHIGINLDDIRLASNLLIEKLYEFDKYLGRIRRRDYTV